VKKPMPPPPFQDLASEIIAGDPQRFTGLFAKYADTVSQQKYLPWDDVRYRATPEGLKPTEWWAVIKMARQGMLRRLALTDQYGLPFQYALPDEVLREIEFVSTNLSGRIGVKEEITNPATRDRYLVSSLIEEAVTSSQLEGASTTRKVAKDMIRSGRKPRDRSERMILNGYRAMERIGELRDADLTLDLIYEIHRIVTEGTLDNPDAAGRFQDPSEERVGVYDSENNLLYAPPTADELVQRMQRVCDFANGKLDQSYLPAVLRAVILHFMIGYEHPFEDGNGRTARALFYWSMLKQGYWMTEFVSVSRILKKAPGQYARAYLYTQSDDNDLTYFLSYNLRVLHRAIDDLNKYLSRKIAEIREVRGLLVQGAAELNHRQLSLLNDALRNPDNVYTLRTHGVSHRISNETARQDLYALEGRGLLAREKMGKRFVFRSVPDLADAIRSIGSN